MVIIKAQTMDVVVSSNANIPLSMLKSTFLKGYQPTQTNQFMDASPRSTTISGYNSKAEWTEESSMGHSEEVDALWAEVNREAVEGV